MSLLKLVLVIWHALHTFIASLFNLFDGHSSYFKDIEVLKVTLHQDYVQLLHFSSKERLFGITEDVFEELFLKGLMKSHDFYVSSDHLNFKNINSLITHNLATHSHLDTNLPIPKSIKVNKFRAFEALNDFSGTWHGHWKNQRVHHNWLQVRKHTQKLNDEVLLLGFQSCFTGDGIGWNYVVEIGNQVIILGFVYHMGPNGEITSENPHYAQLCDQNQLTWISNDHIYYEFVCDQDSNKHYIITGARYSIEHSMETLFSGFQAIYTSSTNELPRFKNLVLSGSKTSDMKNIKQGEVVTDLRFP